MTKPYFTIDEAQKRLIEVKTHLSTAMQIHHLLKNLEEIDVECDDEYDQLKHDVAYNKQWHLLSHELFVELEALTKLGCIIKDLEEGLIDFYSLKEGEEICLCFKHGEEEITHWHDLESGYNGRRPIEELSLSGQ